MDRRASTLATVLAAAGAVWGAVSYLVLWGYTSIVVTRSFVDTPVGLFALFPTRAVLFGIHVVEDHVLGHPFHLPEGSGWIGVVSAVVGSALLVAPLGLAAGVAALVRRRHPPAPDLGIRVAEVDAPEHGIGLVDGMGEPH